MKGADQYFLEFIGTAPTRLVIPIYQRNYSWDIENCAQLFNDVCVIGESDRPSHFSGSVVWVDSPRVPAGTTPLLLIDGQQRTTTVTLLLLALAEFARDNNGLSSNGDPLEFGFEEVINTYVVDPYRKGEDRYRLSLADNDDSTLKYEIERTTGKNLFVRPEHPSERIQTNLEYLRNRVRNFRDQNKIWSGIKRLQIISVRLDASDNPQLVFESMNSTGKSLTASDLIRNFILMGLPIDEQKRLYTTYWRPMEKLFRNDERSFNSFMRNYLTIFFSLLPSAASIDISSGLKNDEIYTRFKQMVLRSQKLTTENLMKKLIESAELYTNLVFAKIDSGTETDLKVQRSLQHLCMLDYTVDEPVVLQLLLARKHGLISSDVLVSALDMIESYLVRRMIAGYATNSLNKFFVSLLRKIHTHLINQAENEGDFLHSFAKELTGDPNGARAFPADDEVRSTLQTLRFYNKQKAGYVLLRLENVCHPKTPFPPNVLSEKIATIEHVLPQNPKGIPEWEAVLGDDNPDEILETWLHNIGNLTLTGYNSELSNGSFVEKKERMIGGYGHDRFALSSDILMLDKWTIDDIQKRCETMTNRILEVWPYPNF